MSLYPAKKCMNNMQTVDMKVKDVPVGIGDDEPTDGLDETVKV